MASLGVFFALTEADTTALFDADGDDAVRRLVKEEIEERWDEEWTCEVDKAWDAMHRCLSDGTLAPNGTLAPDGSPRSSLFFGGRRLHLGDEYVVRFLEPAQVRDAADAIGELDESWFRRRYDTLDAHGYDGPHDDEDFGYTWEYFVEVRAFIQKAADAGRPVLFTVDQ